MAPRTVGLPIHLLYPILAVILLGIAAFASADGVWYVGIQTASMVVSVIDRSVPLILFYFYLCPWIYIFRAFMST
jgi:hypothetical protein